jgi:Protein of unknown function (DUF1566)
MAIEQYLLARVRRKTVEEKDWWFDRSIDDEKRDVSFRLDIELLSDNEQLPGMGGYKLDMIRWARVEYRAMQERNSGEPPRTFFELRPNDHIRILTIPKTQDEVMIDVPPPRFPAAWPGKQYYYICDIQRMSRIDEKSDTVMRLRAEAAVVSADDITKIVRERGFNHPDHHNMSGLCGRVIGTFHPQFELKTLNGDKVVIERVFGLIWQQSGSQRIIWDVSRDYIKQLNKNGYAGCSDWRLPTIEELASLLESTKKSVNEHEQGFYIDPVFDTDQWGVWSADKLEGADVPCAVDFHDGALVAVTVTSTQHVRAVCSIQAHPDLIRSTTRFRWWPRRLKENQGPRRK